MKILEKDLKQIIWESDIETLNKKGLGMPYGKRFLEFKVGNYGTADMIVVKRINGSLYIAIYVFKEGKIGISAFLEAVKIRKGIERFFEKREEYRSYLIEFSIRLVGNEIDTSGSFCYLMDFYMGIDFIKYSLDINGISFKNLTGYNLKEEGF